MVNDWSGVTVNVGGAPIGHVVLTPSAMPGMPIYVAADFIVTAQEDGPGTRLTLGGATLVVRENIREVFRRKAEANTVEEKARSVPSPVLFAGDKPDRVRKKA